MKIYTGAIVAQKPGASIEVHGFAWAAPSQIEAIGASVAAMRDKFPGYTLQVGPFDPIGDESIRLAARALGMITPPVNDVR